MTWACVHISLIHGLAQQNNIRIFVSFFCPCAIFVGRDIDRAEGAVFATIYAFQQYSYPSSLDLTWKRNQRQIKTKRGFYPFPQKKATKTAFSLAVAVIRFRFSPFRTKRSKVQRTLGKKLFFCLEDVLSLLGEASNFLEVLWKGPFFPGDIPLFSGRQTFLSALVNGSECVWLLHFGKVSFAYSTKKEKWGYVRTWSIDPFGLQIYY